MEWYRLETEGLKRSKIKILMENFLNYNDIFKNLKEMEDKFNFTGDDTRIILRSKNNEKYLDVVEYLDKNQIGLISFNDYRYPKNLKNISKPPLFLFYKGDVELLNNDKIISVVGTRRATKYGELGCELIVKDLIEGEVIIVSGLAVGIDSLAHIETLKHEGKTIAILGCGIDIIYPKENINLRKKIEKTGLVISEFPLGTNPKPENFPIRNRIIAGLSTGTVVIESGLKGGSLITAGLALEEGRDVFAFPGDVTYPFSKGCNELIKLSQAKLITTGDDILNEYEWSKVKRSENINVNLSGKKLKIYNLLKLKLHLEEIKKNLGYETSETLSLLMELEIEGYIQSLPAGYYRRRI